MPHAAFLASVPLHPRPLGDRAPACHRRGFVAAPLPRRPPPAQNLRSPSSHLPPTCALASLRTPAVSSILAALPPAIAAATPFTLTFTLLAAATAGLLAQRYAWGKALSAPVVTTLITLLLVNLTPLPSIHPIYTQVTTTLVPLAVPLLLFSADLRRVFRDTRRLVSIFSVGAVATLLGTLVAWRIVPITRVLGAADAWKIAAALCARHIGGAVNYVAVAEATAAGPEAVTAALAADNVITALYFCLLLLLARGVSQPAPAKLAAVAVGPAGASPQASVSEAAIGEEMSPTDAVVGIQDAAVALSLSAGMCTVATMIDALLPFRVGTIPVVTAIALALASSFPRFFGRYRTAAAAVGLFFMQIFFAATGAGGSVISILGKAPLLLLFAIVQLAVHLAFFLGVGGILRFNRSEILIASNANVGGPSTAAGMASAKNWDRLIIPAILVGVFGYSIATFISLAFGYFVLKP